jgi:malate synthase
MIHKYQQWLEESEKMEAETPATPEATPAATETPATEEPAPAETPVEDTVTNDDSTDITSAESEIEQYRTLDTARREAIKAFKAKQEEFLEIPDDVRKNPTEEADKEKVENLKNELIDLNRTMKDAIKAWDSFNAQALGISDDGIDDEP